MPTIVGILTFFEQEKFHAQLSSGSGFLYKSVFSNGCLNLSVNIVSVIFDSISSERPGPNCSKHRYLTKSLTIEYLLVFNCPEIKCVKILVGEKRKKKAFEQQTTSFVLNNSAQMLINIRIVLMFGQYVPI